MPTSGVVGWVGTCANGIEGVRVINIRISSTRPIVAMAAHVPQGASKQADIPATGEIKLPDNVERNHGSEYHRDLDK